MALGRQALHDKWLNVIKLRFPQNPLNGEKFQVNIKQHITATLILLLFLLISQWIIDNYILAKWYIATASNWRNFKEMMNNLPLNIGFMLALSAWATYVFSKIYPEGGFKNGIGFGFYFGVFLGIYAASYYLWLPVPFSLAIGWFITRFIQVLVCGMLLGVMRKK